MQYIDNIIFFLILAVSIVFFVKNIKKLSRNINLGVKNPQMDNKNLRWKRVLKIALGQSEMVKRPISGALHVVVYLGFVIINIEVLEIMTDGLLGTHRVFAPLGAVYNIGIASFEILAFLVLVSVIVFWIRRNIIRVKRFWNKEMTSWPKNDANFILYTEMVLMILFLIMNAADSKLQLLGAEHYTIGGSFPISQYLTGLLPSDISSLILIERGAWWFHIIGIMAFLNYLYYSKHLHILLAFPTTFYSKIEARGQFENLESVTKEVKMMMDPDADPYADTSSGEEEEISSFGAKDIFGLEKRQLLGAYACTECGRCTSVCPASITGKELSPRAIMMKTRDRLEEVSKNIDKNGEYKDDGKMLLNDYIKPEELWACTTCNACTQACPIQIDPLGIIMKMRQYLVMEESAAPQELNSMMTNIENNGAPWQFNQADKLNWAKEDN